MSDKKYIYRYERQYHDEFIDENTTSIHLEKLLVIRETKSTYVVKLWNNKEKRVVKNAKNSFAYDSTEKAKQNFINRCKKQIQICNSHILAAQIFLTKSTEL